MWNHITPGSSWDGATSAKLEQPFISTTSTCSGAISIVEALKGTPSVVLPTLRMLTSTATASSQADHEPSSLRVARHGVGRTSDHPSQRETRPDKTGGAPLTRAVPAPPPPGR